MEIGDFVIWELNAERVQITGIMHRQTGKEYFCTMSTESGPVEKVFHRCEISTESNKPFGYNAKK
jgi:hypothetical protein